MKDLFEKEEQVLVRTEHVLAEIGEKVPSEFQKEYEYLAGEYAQVLRQLRWVTRISDLTAMGLNTDKTVLLNKVNIDALTEIYNRRYLMTNLEHYLEMLEEEGGWISVLMLDVDYFKSFNDTYGHPVGDICLRKVANALHVSLSGSDDFVVRYGGEEFIAVLPGADRQMGLRAANRIQENLHNLNIPHAKSEVSDRVTLSIGQVSAIPRAHTKMQDYIDRADAALYLSKKNGRNCVTFLSFEEDIQ